MSVQSVIEDSTTAQWLISRGQTFGEALGEARAERDTLRLTLLRQGRRKFGLEATAAERLNAITDTRRLERMTDRILDATSWDELFATE